LILLSATYDATTNSSLSNLVILYTHNPNFRHIDEAATIKLADIEQLLKPYCHPAFVHNVITGLIKRYKETGDYSIFDRALENHRRNIERYYGRY